ncbi:hypothetical protein PR202_ga22418 [Eleusine coracana subsp. coracana]|uniref:Dirigent protein n=1 Tax=Eleusine coracana subsp. coracana TaxID=191504 RepID=A0AAV5D1N7_ELECO|nr:hypothetical protein PR202_ga22418 [Eleusine coracana subsp. coracana]
MHLYLNQVASGTNPNPNQLVLLRPSDGLLGVTAVNDWSITTLPGANNKAVAKAQGLHMKASQTSNNWYLSFNIQFQDASFAGSTLNVMGIFPDNGEWSIIGGTGAFSMAQGIIKHNIIQDSDVQRIYELNIHAFCTNMTSGWVSNYETTCVD